MSPRLSRRRFIQAGLAGGAVLAAAGALETWRVRRGAAGDPTLLSPAGRALFGAVLPAFLTGVVPPGGWTAAARQQAVDAVEESVRALPPHAQAELQQLVALLDHRMARALLAGVWGGWESLGAEDARRFLGRWRRSRFALLAGAYQALHDLSFASWYADPAHWGPTGYPGPPRIDGVTT